MKEEQNGQNELDRVCQLADELAQSIVNMRTCRCHGTGVAVSIVDGDIITAPCSCAIAAEKALDNWKEIQSNLCRP